MLRTGNFLGSFSLSAACVAAGLCSGCAGGHPPAVSARNSDTEVRDIVAARIPVGSTPEQVESGLDALGVSGKYRMNYAATDARPRVLLARLFEPGGFWLHSDDDLVEWVDVSFVFTQPPEKLDRTIVFRDKLRYFQREPIVYPHAPKRALMARPGRFPAPIPPPEDPMVIPQ